MVQPLETFLYEALVPLDPAIRAIITTLAELDPVSRPVVNYSKSEAHHILFRKIFIIQKLIGLYMDWIAISMVSSANFRIQLTNPFSKSLI